MARHVLPAVALTEPKSPATEAYRTLRTNIQYAALDRPVKSMLVTSAGPSEGKSMTAANLAAVLAQSGKETLLVDCDLRKPMQHRVFGLKNTSGLSNCLVQHLPPESLVHATQQPHLSVLTAGIIPPNPAELLDSKRMEEALGEMMSRYEAVVLDGPPLIAVTDAALLAPKVDGVLLVLKAGEARIDLAKEAKAILENATARILGCVLNGMRHKQRDYHYYHYYGEKSASYD